MRETAPPIRVPQFRSFIDESDYHALKEVFDRNYIAEGPCANTFRDKLQEMIGAPYAVLASNGTVALYLALKALGIGPGDEVIVQDVTFIATANAVEMVGATPRFVDIPAFDDLTVDISRIEVGPRTKAVMVAHLFGTACRNIEEVRAFCREHGLFLVEDAAQALGITNGETACGMFGDAGTFSFYADKTITAGEGGLVVTPHEHVYERMRLLRNQGRPNSGTFVHPEIGFNFRVTDMQGALGLSQLSKLDTIIADKRRIHERYAFGLGGRVRFLRIREDFSYIPFRVVAFVEDADHSIDVMRAHGVEPRAMFYPLHRQPCYAHLGPAQEDAYPNADECLQRGICLPTWVGLPDADIDYTIEALLASLG